MTRKLATALILSLAVACGGGGSTPGGAVEQFFNAVNDRDGDEAAGLICRSSLDDMNSLVEEMKADTTGIAMEMLAGRLGVEITQEELSGMDGMDLAALVLGSDAVLESFPEYYEILDIEIEGEHAFVRIQGVLGGESYEDVLDLVLESGGWKLEMGSF